MNISTDRNNPSLRESGTTGGNEPPSPVAPFPATTIRVWILLFDPLRIAGLQTLFANHSGIEIVVGATGAAVPGSGWLDPSVQVALIGAQAGNETRKLLASMGTERPGLPVIVMSPAAGEEAVLSILSLGAKGVLHDSSTAAEFEHAIHAVTSGCLWASRRMQALLIERLLAARESASAAASGSFTPREQEVLDLLLDGKSNREIAQSLKIEERTVKAYITRLMAKSGVTNRTALSMKTAAAERSTLS